ncbi:MAG: AAA family ATPase [Limisphaerales bacterium]
MGTPHYVMSLELQRGEVADLDRYPYNIPALRELEHLEFHPRCNFFIGENGSGKSTLLEALAVKLDFNAEGGTKNMRFATRESHSDLHEHLRVARNVQHRPMDGFFFRAESFFNVATHIEELDEEPGGPQIIWSYGNRSLHEQSHGESFLALMTHRVDGHGVYLLDEPEAALSPQRQLAILSRIHDVITDHSQFFIATHSPILLAYPDAWIFEFSESGIQRVEYRDTEHYQVTQSFLDNPDRMLDILLGRLL